MISSRALLAAVLLAVAACGGSSSSPCPAGSTPPQFQACLASASAAQRVNADEQEGVDFGVQGTPTFFVNGVQQFGLPQATTLDALVVTALEKARQSNVPCGSYYEQVVMNGAGLAAVPLDSAPVRGPPDACVTLVEYSDFECPFCRNAEPTVEAVLANRPADVRLVYKQFPLTSLHPRAMPAALASVCAGDQQKFWEMHDLLMAGDLSDACIASYARQLGLQ